MEKRLPPGLDKFGTIIMIHAIIQRTKAAVSHCQTGLVSWMPSASIQPRSATQRVEETWPPCLPILSRWRNSACDCFDILHWNANSISARAGGWEPLTIFHLHLSRLILLAPTGPLQTLASTISVPRAAWTSGDGRRADTARSQVLRWAVDDQFKARLAVIHSGALFWHVRRYSIDSFVEPFGIYMATLVLWAYSTSVQSATQACKQAAEQQSATTRAGTGSGSNGPSHCNPSPSLSASASLPMTGLDECEPLQFHIDRPCDDEIVQAYVRHGQKMSGLLSQVGDLCQEGAPKRILLQGQQIFHRRRRFHAQPSDDRSTASGNGNTGEFVWGVADGFIDILRNLAESSGA